MERPSQRGTASAGVFEGGWRAQSTRNRRRPPYTGRGGAPCSRAGWPRERGRRPAQDEPGGMLAAPHLRIRRGVEDLRKGSQGREARVRLTAAWAASFPAKEALEACVKGRDDLTRHSPLAGAPRDGQGHHHLSPKARQADKLCSAVSTDIQESQASCITTQAHLAASSLSASLGPASPPSITALIALNNAHAPPRSSQAQP